MGLDMYLERMPRYKETTAREVNAITNYFNWMRAKEEGSEYANCTLEEWCGINEETLPSNAIIEHYRQFYKMYYSDWDEEKKYPTYGIMDEVGYWRKSNQIHHWLVENVQDGVDDCNYYDVSKEQLEELLDICKRVLESCVMIPGKVRNGSRYSNGDWEPIYEEGLVVVDKSIAIELLPPTHGFFFGSYDIDEYYVNDIANTIRIIEDVLKTTDFETQMISYCSSW